MVYELNLISVVNKRNITIYLINRIKAFIFYYLVFWYYCFIIPLVSSTSEINLTIEGKGEQIILNELFYIEPSKVLVNGEFIDSCKKCFLLRDDINNITLIFDEEINSCENMFNNLQNMTFIDLSSFDTSKVTNMHSMFFNCTNLKKIIFGKINTSLVQDMSSLFSNCYNLIYIDLSNFITSKVTNMSRMFSHCEIIKSIDASSFNTEKVEDMEDMFGYCYKLVSVNVSSFDTSKVQTMKGMFYDCNELKYLDLENFKGNSLTNMEYMLFECRGLIFLNLKNFQIQSSTKTDYAFLNIPQNLMLCVGSSADTDCENPCFQKNIKIDMKQNICINSCGDKFEFNNLCYNDCPENTLKLLKNKNLCSYEIPENFYLDSDDNVYKQCFETCNKCTIKGNEIYNNCDECKDDFIFLNESFINKNNCFKKCEYFYYFNEQEQYSCTQNYACPERYKKLVKQKNKCIDKCENDDYYKYEFNNTCIEFYTEK